MFNKEYCWVQLVQKYFRLTLILNSCWLQPDSDTWLKCEEALKNVFYIWYIWHGHSNICSLAPLKASICTITCVNITKSHYFFVISPNDNKKDFTPSQNLISMSHISRVLGRNQKLRHLLIFTEQNCWWLRLCSRSVNSELLKT